MGVYLLVKINTLAKLILIGLVFSFSLTMSRQSLSGKVRRAPRLTIIELLHEKLDVEKFFPFTEKKFLILFGYINHSAS